MADHFRRAVSRTDTTIDKLDAAAVRPNATVIRAPPGRRLSTPCDGVSSALSGLHLLKSRVHYGFGGNPIREFLTCRKSAPLGQQIRLRRYQLASNLRINALGSG
jgi:hypothetical protein